MLCLDMNSQSFRRWDKFGSLPTAENMAKMLRYCTNLSSQIIPFKLPDDLENGRWEKSYGEVLKTDKIDAGYYFLLEK
jgi:hypothetical protein